MLTLAKLPHVAIKITGACTLSLEAFPYNDIWDPVCRMIDAFGIDRCLWGTDWTRAVKFLNYAQGVDAFRVTDRISDSDKAKLMGGTARVFTAGRRGRPVGRRLVVRNPGGDAVILPRRKLLHSAAAVAALPLLSRIAIADDAYPSRPVHLIVGFTPGAAADVVGRVFSQAAGPILGQQVVVENKPGAGSSIAAEYAAHSAKDGYTVFLGTLSIITNQIINPNAALDLTRDFEPVALIQDAPIILVVNPARNIHSVKELVALCKAHPDRALDLNVIGSMPHFASELFAQAAGVKLTQVPYQGSPQAVEDVVADRTLMTFSPVSTVVGLIAAGKLLALATTTGKRAGALRTCRPWRKPDCLPSTPASGWPVRAGRHAAPDRRQACRRGAKGHAYAVGHGSAEQAGRRSARCRPRCVQNLHEERNRPLDESRADCGHGQKLG